MRRLSRRRIRAILAKELQTYRRTGSIIVTMSIIPLIFLIQPVVSALTIRTRAALPDPDRIFADLPAVERWSSDSDGSYLVSVSDTEAAAPAITRALVASGADVLSISESYHSLEDVYLELIDEDTEALRQ